VSTLQNEAAQSVYAALCVLRRAGTAYSVVTIDVLRTSKLFFMCGIIHTTIPYSVSTSTHWEG
jgi:hypothetical protein